MRALAISTKCYKKQITILNNEISASQENLRHWVEIETSYHCFCLSKFFLISNMTKIKFQIYDVGMYTCCSNIKHWMFSTNIDI